jgi:hypothetical protein
VFDEIQMQAALQTLGARDQSLIVGDSLLSGKYDRCCTVVELRPSCPTKHLHHLEVRVFLATTILPSNGVFDDDKLTGQIDADGEC